MRTRRHVTAWCINEEACWLFCLYHPEPAGTDPSIEIRRSLKDLLKGDGAVLECDVTRLPSRDLYITFQANGVDISDKQFVELPAASGLLSISRSFTVHSNELKKDASFTCKVNQGFSNSFVSNSTGSFFGERRSSSFP